jgi:DNA-directed RNA polymerase specialized sigma24 family protein
MSEEDQQDLGEEQQHVRRRLPGLTDVQKAEILVKYAQGATIRELVEKYGSSYGRIHHLISGSKLGFRSRGPRSKQ